MTNKNTIKITDDIDNVIFQFDINENKIPLKTLMHNISNEIEQYILKQKALEGFVMNLQTEIADMKEAFEHTDDSLHNLRIKLKHLLGEKYE